VPWDSPVTLTAQDVEAGHVATNTVLSLKDDTAWSRLMATRAAAAVTAKKQKNNIIHNIKTHPDNVLT